MRCGTCNYRLWNLEARRCPECGTPFLPSQYEFAPNSVQFCCPHCGQAYYGTGARGHLVPDEFDCVQCARHIRMNEMVLRPAAHVTEEQTEVYKLPWEERRERGPVRAWWGTVKMALTSPIRLARAVPDDCPPGAAWGFALLTALLYTAGVACPWAALAVIATTSTGGRWDVELVCGLPLVGLVAAATVIVGIAFWGLIAHGVLRLGGRPAGGIGRTYIALCYSSGANALLVLPCVGIYVSWIWWLISAALMLKETQRVGGGRATLATLVFPLLLIGGLTTAWVIAIRAAMAAAGAVAWTASGGAALPPGYATTTLSSLPNPADEGETEVVMDALLTFARGNAGQGPTHAAQLVALHRLSGSALVAWDSTTFEEDVAVGSVRLDELEELSLAQANAAADAAARALPPRTIAHRLGDFVFTYHGLDLTQADPELWVVIRQCDPEANPGTTMPFVFVGRADGTVLRFTADQFRARRAEQNELRASHDLAPLPDPATVTHTRPAVAP
ncbi:MAG: hypothetical protein KA383_03445 [Phycisphaerae bacterium]|nr:hypothetical protein [Phycisphaerae bacterium]